MAEFAQSCTKIKLMLASSDVKLTAQNHLIMIAMTQSPLNGENISTCTAFRQSARVNMDMDPRIFSVKDLKSEVKYDIKGH